MRPGPRPSGRTPVVLVVAGVLAPALVVAVAPSPDALPVSGRRLVVLAALAFGVVSWFLIERLGLDRLDFLLASVAIPWVVLLVGVHVVLLLNQGEQVPRGPVADVFGFLVGPVADLFVYGAAYGLAGAGAVGLSKAAERTSGRALGPDD